ncbi:hypothetical protein [Croceicoccus sp. YJ47]|uniref:hypothetical protein n=1 Tax=Croceicoccus sp. YJ47 TaxID=2798724 RepID=UPI001922B397|nr:hypothetical protein [Croceicoccus sp. YJ47]QQN73937.1 hypothetical protein JD971_14500 [Croceicoccus sp. YJ47]
MTLSDMLIRTQRAALIGALVETFENNSARLSLIRDLHAAEIISGTTADMLVEIYSMESA